MGTTTTTTPKFPDRYIGDGVYTSFDGYHIWLTTQEGMRIALEPPVYDQLVRYQSDLITCYREASNGAQS
jgi:hypothetical protein